MFLATTTAANSGVMSTGMLIMWLVIMFGMMYFLMIRPQKKEQKKLQAMLNDLAVGDAVITTSGFYGVVIDITDDDVIVEFGNNKNCRIPMRKTAITEVENRRQQSLKRKQKRKNNFTRRKARKNAGIQKERMPAFFSPPKLLRRNTAKTGKNAAYFSFKWQKSKKIIAFRPMQRNFVLKLPEKWRII